MLIIETFQTVLTFLPPIPCPITEFSTVCKTKHRSIHLSKISNMTYLHIAVNVGAAEKYYKAICINPDEFKDVFLNLGDFHDFMHFFSNCKKFLSNRRFEEILYQARMCSVGGIKTSLIREVFARCTEEFKNMVCIGVSTLPPSQKYPVLLFCQVPVKSANCQCPPF